MQANEMNTAALNKPVLKEGATGDVVKELQTLLNKYICKAIKADGIFGAGTTKAVKEFQNRMFLTADGIVGNKSWQALFSGAPVDMPILQRGSKGLLVVAVQKRLQLANIFTGVADGDYGPRTEAAVRTLQQNTGLPVDGKVGSRTWFELSKIFVCN